MPGLSVGDPHHEVKGVLCALDPLPSTIEEADRRGLDMVVTHHPAFIEPPKNITPSYVTSGLGGVIAWTAASMGISLVAAHTNLDKSEDAFLLASELLAMEAIGRIQEPDGFGVILDGGSRRVRDVCSAVTSGFGATPLVYGDDDAPAPVIGYCSGSLGDLGLETLSRGCTCVVTGECGYHRATELQAAGCAVILMGHDVSELPYSKLLASVLGDRFPELRVEVLDESPHAHAFQLRH
ncbi:MAG: Nif3-like dinuclear metal center hexameric protein [Atopobiaceae bacterium]|jgi:putative NIF3 family GTP cyclohydrolase 1 type 2|nr:Nif3-like dinuclear metal center hexameric protein [Atopobiaceae bacterium]MCI2173206.1 Nif3-like dinuclear metal center hexameric protein [Atopobiaceae bacterium]MCI2207201.1 Nif3-like dinuclear metal center hexameric protein [Atopobiaceae bacterium]